MKFTTEQIIKEFKKVHGDKYDYSKVDYKNVDSKVIIRCKEHGEFQQTPYYHKNGQRCPKCSGNTKLSTEEVIQQFKEVHGNKYDYSKVDYKNIDSKVMIICKEHGVFLQSPYNHRARKECPKCSGVGLSREEIIAQFRKVHGNKYDYSKTECTNTRSPIIIICPEHGEFSQNTNSHKQGNGCPKCSGTMKLTQSEIIEEFKTIHGEKYDYSNVNYIGANSKIIIICPEHGEFQQTPSSHKQGSGCPKCLGMGNTTEEIILQFKEVHGDKYDYSKVKFLNNDTKVAILCKKHGEFFQIPKIHKLGSGCPKCSGRNFSIEEIIEQFRKVHGERYDYSKFNYSNIKLPVTIICKQHGEFQQTPDSHKRGSGCPKCNFGWTKNKILEYLNSIENQELFKMDTVEWLMIMNQGKLPHIFRNLAFADEDNKENTLKALKEKLQAAAESDDYEESPPPEESDEEDWNEDEAETEDIEGNENKEEESSETETETETDTKTEKQKLISLSNTNEDLHVLDHDLVSSCDAEVIEFLIQYKLRKIWNQVLNEEFSVKQFKAETGGANFTLLQKYFFDEYNEVLKYKPPVGYAFPYPPNLMQKLTVFRLLKHQRYGNWSGTGAGKTLSFILSSRSVDARLTLLIGLNSTIEQLGKNILQAYPDSKVFTHYKPGQKFNRKNRNYLILNYDKFQQEYSEKLFQDLTDHNQIDFIAIDEIHNAKQRTEKQESIRRGTIKRIIGRASTNKNLYVLGMSATPVINNLTEAKSLLEMVTGKDYKDFSTMKTLANALEAFKHLSLNGLRYIPKYEIQIKELTGENTPKLKLDGSGLLEELLSISNANYSKAEQILLSKKLEAIRNYLRAGVILYTHYTTGMIDPIVAFVKSCGFKFGTYTGEEPLEEREAAKQKFLSGKIDILIGSRPIGTGVDGLQEKCNRMIILSLPWTDSEYTQLKGRIYRQGSKFGEVEILIPQVYIQLEEKEWSWDRQRINLIRNKKTLADAAIDGVVPSKKIPSLDTLFKKSQEALREWKERIGQGKLFIIQRKDLVFPLRPEIVEQLSRTLGDFSTLNRVWSTSNSKTTHTKLTENPEDWYYYHTLYRERRKEWSEIPYVEIGKMITRKEMIVADLGCGEDLLRKEIPKNKVLSFDHVAVNKNVTPCDISHLPLENESIDIAVFSLSLMGANYKEYLQEAYRVLKAMGVLLIAEPISKWEAREEELTAILSQVGFEKPTLKKTKQFVYVSGIKFRI
jgi:superfamily II DNA or RNA helicase/protein-arginine kinase activator protein McsA